MFSPTTSADHWLPWLVIACVLAPFVLFAVLGRPRAVLWTFGAELAAFVLMAVWETWLFLAWPVVLGAGFAATALCYWLAILSRTYLWRGTSGQQNKY